MPPPKQGSPEWIAERRKGVGASDIPVLAGLVPWSSPYALYLEKRGEQEVEEESTEAMTRGRILEEPVARWWSLETGRAVRRHHAIIVHPRYEWARASLDRTVVGAAEELEAKTTSDRWTEPPEEVMAQVQWQLGVGGYRLGHVAALTGGLRFQRWVIQPDRPYFEDLLAIGWEFWRRVQEGRPPEVDGSEATRQALTRAYPAETEPLIRADAALLDLAAELQEAIAAEKASGNHADTIRNAIRAALGPAAGVEGPGFKITYTKNRDSATTRWEDLARALLRELSEEEAVALVGVHTDTKSGPRVLRPTFDRPLLRVVNDDVVTMVPADSDI